MALTSDDETALAELSFEAVVARYYRPLYQFAFSLTRAEAEACDLTQQTYYIWARKGHQLRDATKVKTWLFTTLHREFLKARRHATRFPHEALDEGDPGLPLVEPAVVEQLDAAEVVAALGRIPEMYRAPLALFYLDDLTYKEIADVLALPMGTVQSRVARGKARLQHLLANKEPHD